MSKTITVSYKDEPVDLPECRATDQLAIVPGMALTQNQMWGLIHTMEGDENAEVKRARVQLLDIAGPLPELKAPVTF